MKEQETVTLKCLYCGEEHEFAPDSKEAEGVFNVFCDGECEDCYAATL